MELLRNRAQMPSLPMSARDVLIADPRNAVEIGQAALCPHDHIYDVRDWDVCPVCASGQRLMLAAVLGTVVDALGEKDFLISALKLPDRDIIAANGGEE